MNILITLVALIISVAMIAGGVILFMNLLLEQPVKVSVEIPRFTAGKPSPTKGAVMWVMLYAILFGLLISVMLTQLWDNYQAI